MSAYQFVRNLKIILYIIRKSKLYVISSMMLCPAYSSVYAQHTLSQHVTLPRFERMTIRTIFDELKQRQSVLFSYNSSLLDIDQQVSMDAYDGILIHYMERLLGHRYSFKEVNAHIIITYTPERMDVSTVDMDTAKNNRMMISGYVRDIRTNKPIRFVSVYDHTTFQASTLTDKRGYFELEIRKPEHAVTVALNKEDYRDTMLVLLLPLDIPQGYRDRKVGYYHFTDSSKTIANSAFGRFFTGSRQRIQSLNVGGFFVYSPFQISMTPGLSTHGLMNSQVVNKFSLNIIGGYTAGVTGTELAGVFNVNQFSMQGFQMAGVSNVVGGDIIGFQAAGGSNVGLNRLYGVQLSGVWNSADTVVAGVQLTGGINKADNAARGMQLAGLMNISKGEVGQQVAGGINRARKVRGLQLAVVNIADSSDYPVGVFNWIKNGSRQLSVGIDESNFASLHFRSGGRVMYSVLGGGTYLDHGDFRYGVEAGIGAHLLRRPLFTLSTEVVHRTHFDKDLKYDDTNRSSFRIIPALCLGRHFQVYAAPSLTYAEAANPEQGTKGVVWKIWGNSSDRNTLHGGGTVGLSYVFSR